jgi:pimeloyl-ACP methyl ester carboxylesterase
MPGAKISRDDGVELAYESLAGESLPGSGPVLVFLPGFASDMRGTKAIFLHETCAAQGQAMLRLDYSGHGASGGRFEDGTIGQWTGDAALVIETVTGDAPLILVGSSMGGWIALLLALRFGSRVQALLLIAPAPDFTEALMLPNLTPAQRSALANDGVIYPPSEYGTPIPITQKLIDDGRNHLLLGENIAIRCPVRVLHGMQDPDVPWQHSLKLAESLESADVRLIFIKDGDHRLSRDADLALLRDTVLLLLHKNAA